MASADLGAQINANSGDRLGFGLFIAAAAHACLIFGFAIDVPESQTAVADLEVTLVTQFSEQVPVDADFWAQDNQAASGTEQETLKLTTNTPEAADGDNDAEGQELAQSSIAELVVGAEVLVSNAESASQENTETDAEQEKLSQEAELLAKRKAIRAALDVKQQEYARRPKIGTLTSVSAKARDDAAYQLHLQEKIVSNGNANYPQAALQQGIFGDLRLKMTLLQDGTLESTEILESSGHLVLDRAALEIARKSAPFQSFPPETALRYDKIVFIRTWQFLPGGLLRTDE